MKMHGIISLLLCLVILCSCLVPLNAAAAYIYTAPMSLESMQISNGCSTLDAQMPLLGSSKLLDTAGAAILFECNTQTLMYAWNPDLRLEPASLVKIMTAVLALEQGDPKERIVVTEDALRMLSGSSTTDLKTGEEISLNDLLNCLMVGSSNDAAVVIAQHISGSQEAFVAQMNQKAAQLNMHGTVFTNPHGLPDELQVTTARDMGKLLAYAAQVDGFASYFATNFYTVPATNLSEERVLSSTNYMMMQDKPLYYDARVTGGRTGITEDRNRCLAVTAEQGELNYVAVILDAVPVFKEDGHTVKRFGSYEEMRELLEMGFDGYATKQILTEGQILMQCSVINGANVVGAMPAENVRAILPNGITWDQLTVQYAQNIRELNAPVVVGDPLTTIQVWYQNVCIAESTVIAGNSAPIKTSLVTPHRADTKTGAGKVILIVLGSLLLIALLVFGVLRLVRSFRKLNLLVHRRRRRSERRRSKP